MCPLLISKVPDGVELIHVPADAGSSKDVAEGCLAVLEIIKELIKYIENANKN